MGEYAGARVTGVLTVECISDTGQMLRKQWFIIDGSVQDDNPLPKNIRLDFSKACGAGPGYAWYWDEKPSMSAEDKIFYEESTSARPTFF